MKRWLGALVVFGIGVALTTEAPHALQSRNHNGSTRQEQGRQVREQTDRRDGAPKTGDEAPLFSLKSLDGETETDLASYHGKRPVILLFGSYT
jgi:hypothetical protein